MMWVKVYQSVRCCEFSELATTPCHSLMYPHLHHGTRPIQSSVLAAANWGDPVQTMVVPPAPDGSHERLLRTALARPSLVVFPDDRTTPWLGERLGHRAIGVVYRPTTERWGNWVPTVMGRRYDALLSFDETRALAPLGPEPVAPRGELETYPWST